MFRGEKEESLAPSQTPDSGADEAFTRRLKQCGFRTATVTVRARKPGKGGRHTVWLAEKP
jgi:hypothetical protein